jgi:hypothetical protein
VSLNDQVCASLDTSADEIVDPVAFRVFARSVFEYDHEPEPGAGEAAALAATVVQPDPAVVVPFPPQPATSRPAATITTALWVMRPFMLSFTSFTSRVSYLCACYLSAVTVNT